jgi:hypothetical protein
VTGADPHGFDPNGNGIGCEAACPKWLFDPGAPAPSASKAESRGRRRRRRD